MHGSGDNAFRKRKGCLQAHVQQYFFFAASDSQPEKHREFGTSKYRKYFSSFLPFVFTWSKIGIGTSYKVIKYSSVNGHTLLLIILIKILKEFKFFVLSNYNTIINAMKKKEAKSIRWFEPNRRKKKKKGKQLDRYCVVDSEPECTGLLQNGHELAGDVHGHEPVEPAEEPPADEHRRQRDAAAAGDHPASSASPATSCTAGLTRALQQPLHDVAQAAPLRPTTTTGHSATALLTSSSFHAAAAAAARRRRPARRRQARFALYGIAWYIFFSLFFSLLCVRNANCAGQSAPRATAIYIGRWRHGGGWWRQPAGRFRWVPRAKAGEDGDPVRAQPRRVGRDVAGRQPRFGEGLRAAWRARAPAESMTWRVTCGWGLVWGPGAHMDGRD